MIREGNRVGQSASGSAHLEISRAERVDSPAEPARGSRFAPWKIGSFGVD
jgi:hypothetical protein